MCGQEGYRASQGDWIAGDQRDKLQKAQGNPSLKKVMKDDFSEGVSLAVKMIP